MYEGATVGVVVPAYNEERSVGEVVEAMPDLVDRVYLVDDASTDGTWREIQTSIEAARERESASSRPFEERWVPVRHERNQGVGGAIVTGYERALADGIDATAVMAGDAQMDPALLSDLLDPVVTGDVEYAKASRLLRPRDWKGMPAFRLFGSVLLTLLTRISSGYWRMTDPQNGYTVISRRALATLDLAGLYEEYGFANDILAKLNAADLPIADIEARADYVYGDDWESHIDMTEFIPRTSLLLLSNFFWRLREKHLRRSPRSFVALYALGIGGALVSGADTLAHVLGADDGVADGVAVFAASLLALIVAMTCDRVDNRGLSRRVYRDEADRRG